MILTVCLLLTLSTVSYVTSFGMLGQANFEFQKAEKCPDEPTGVTFEVTGRRLDRSTFALSVVVESPYDFDDHLGIDMQGSQLLDGGYKKGSFQLNDKNACKTMDLLIGDVFHDFKKQANVTDCPVPKGKYVVNDFIFDNEKFTVPQVFGDYRMQIMTTHDGVPQSCLYAYYKLIPKNKV